jgi:hypothetical protein
MHLKTQEAARCSFVLLLDLVFVCAGPLVKPFELKSDMLRVQGPNPTVMKLVSTAAAAQLFLLPIAGKLRSKVA